MNTAATVLNRIRKIAKTDQRFHEEAYVFVLAAMDYAVSKLDSPRHIHAKELLRAIREYGVQQYGPMTLTVLDFWGIHTTDDFGKIVFNLLEEGVLRKQETDSIEDFKEVFDFKEAFKSNYN